MSTEFLVHVLPLVFLSHLPSPFLFLFPSYFLLPPSLFPPPLPLPCYPPGSLPRAHSRAGSSSARLLARGCGAAPSPEPAGAVPPSSPPPPPACAGQGSAPPPPSTAPAAAWSCCRTPSSLSSSSSSSPPAAHHGPPRALPAAPAPEQLGARPPRLRAAPAAARQRVVPQPLPLLPQHRALHASDAGERARRVAADHHPVSGWQREGIPAGREALGAAVGPRPFVCSRGRGLGPAAVLPEAAEGRVWALRRGWQEWERRDGWMRAVCSLRRSGVRVGANRDSDVGLTRFESLQNLRTCNPKDRAVLCLKQAGLNCQLKRPSGPLRGQGSALGSGIAAGSWN